MHSRPASTNRMHIQHNYTTPAWRNTHTPHKGALTASRLTNMTESTASHPLHTCTTNRACPSQLKNPQPFTTTSLCNRIIHYFSFVYCISLLQNVGCRSRECPTRYCTVGQSFVWWHVPSKLSNVKWFLEFW